MSNTILLRDFEFNCIMDSCIRQNSGAFLPIGLCNKFGAFI